MAIMETSVMEQKLAKEGFAGREYVLATKDVVNFFHGRCAALNRVQPEDTPGTWVPAAVSSFARTPFWSSHELHVERFSPGEGEVDGVEWFDLAKVPIGDSVGRVSCQDTQWSFIRRKADLWAVRVTA
jgi:hypothetical protein